MPLTFFPTITDEEILRRLFNYHGTQHVNLDMSMPARDFLFLTDLLEEERKRAEDIRRKEESAVLGAFKKK